VEKMKKRILALSLTLILAISLLAACGGGEGTSGSGDGVTVRFQTIGWGNPGDDKMQQLSSQVNAHLATLGKEYKVDLIFGEGNDYTDRTNLMLASGGNEFDIIFISNWAANFYANAAAGYLTPLGPYLAQYPDIERILTSDFMNASRVNGENYALPTNKEKARTYGWVFREDIVEALGMDLAHAETLPYGEARSEYLEPFFYRAKEEHNLWSWPMGALVDYQFDRVLDPIVHSRIETGATNVVADVFEKEFQDAVRKCAKWFADGIINPDLTRESSGNTEMATGRYFAMTWQLKPGKDKELEGEIDGDFKFVQLVMNQPEIAFAETTGAMLAIPHGASNPDEAFDFINLLYTDAALINIIIFGVEGEDFEFTADGRVELSDSAWARPGGWTMGNQFNNYLRTNEALDKWDQFIAFNESARVLPLFGFVPDATSTDIQTWFMALQTVRDNYDDFFRGYIAVDQVDAEFDKLRAEYETAGINDLLAAIQEQVNKWLAGNWPES